MNRHWTVRLAEIADRIDYGVTASAARESVGPKFLRITDIQDGTVDWSTVPFCTAPAKKLAAAALMDGDIVFARTGATTGKSFRVSEPPKGAVFASYLIRVRPSARIESRYLSHFFRTSDYWNQIASKSQGAAQEGVNATKLADLSIPLPPLDEQRRIATILDKADALRQKRKRAIALLETLTQSIFLEMFGHPLSWQSAEPLEAVARFLGGATPSKAVKSFWTGQIPWVSPKDMKVDAIADAEDHVDASAIERSPLQMIPSGSILIVVRGMILAHTFPSALTERDVTINQDMKAVVFSDSIVPEFGFWCIRSLSDYVLSKVSTAAHGTRKLDMEVVRSLPIMVAPRGEQERFVAVARKARSALNLATRAEQRLHDCFASLQRRAFSSDGEEIEE